jgi:hypothetical protein
VLVPLDTSMVPFTVTPPRDNSAKGRAPTARTAAPTGMVTLSKTKTATGIVVDVRCPSMTGVPPGGVSVGGVTVVSTV